jgi:hypothetical protein
MGLVLLVVISFMVYLGWTSVPALFLANFLVFAAVILAQPVLAKAFGLSTANRRIPMYGSRFVPVEGTAVNTAPTDPMALEDRPVQGTVSTA